MKANPDFLSRPMPFWANIRAISETIGYTERGQDSIKIPTRDDIIQAMALRGLKTDHLVDRKGNFTDFGKRLNDYFCYRAETLNNFVQPRLMNAAEARTEFNHLKRKLKPTCPLPLNKQKGKKKTYAYLTGLVNMMIQSELGKDVECDFDPRSLTTITRNGEPIRTLSRRLDGAFPSTVNPIAVWEIKEYYYTTTFGSRVADGVYESLMDGMELRELREHENIKVIHYLFIDAHYTWWVCGKSYLCRIFDSLHMGYLDEVLVGREIIERLPDIVKEWKALLKSK